jgi:hypothetical protein
MKTLTRGLLSSAAGLFVVAGAQAADLPVKAKPVEYVKVCDLYGAGFWYVPGTDTCIKIGTYVQFYAAYGATSGGTFLGTQGGYGGSDGGGSYARGTDNFGARNRNDTSIDLRTQTEYGTLRSYVDLGTNFGAGGFSTATNGATAPLGNNSLYITRAFFQFAGFTAGRIRSFFDMVNPGVSNNLQNRFSGDTSGGGIVGMAYTYEFGNGWSASLSMEDPGVDGGARGKSTINLGGPNWTCGGTAALNTACQGAGIQGNQYSQTPPDPQNAQTAFGLNYFQTDPKGTQFFDPLLNIRLDQSWGFAGFSAALHDASGGYYGSCLATSATVTVSAVAGLNSVCTNPASTQSGHPADAYGYALSAAFTLTNVFGLPGDTLAVQGVFAHGAVGYATTSWGATTIYGSGNNVSMNWLVDGIYNTGTGVALTNVWTAVGYYEHLWNAKWRSSLYFGLMAEDFGSAGKAMICPNGSSTSNPTGFTFPNPNYGGAFLGGVTNCNPNTSALQFGSRTLWNPVPDVDVALDFGLYHLNTAFEGQAMLPAFGNQFNPGSFQRPGGLYNITNTTTFAGAFRFQRNFLY